MSQFSLGVLVGCLSTVGIPLALFVLLLLWEFLRSLFYLRWTPESKLFVVNIWNLRFGLGYAKNLPLSFKLQRHQLRVPDGELYFVAYAVCGVLVAWRRQLTGPETERVLRQITLENE